MLNSINYWQRRFKLKYSREFAVYNIRIVWWHIFIPNFLLRHELKSKARTNQYNIFADFREDLEFELDGEPFRDVIDRTLTYRCVVVISNADVFHKEGLIGLAFLRKRDAIMFKLAAGSYDSIE